MYVVQLIGFGIGCMEGSSYSKLGAVRIELLRMEEGGRMALKTEWTKHESYTSARGTVTLVDGEWVGRVNLPGGRIGRLAETFMSVAVAMGEVERRWEKENVGYTMVTS